MNFQLFSPIIETQDEHFTLFTLSTVRGLAYLLRNIISCFATIAMEFFTRLLRSFLFYAMLKCILLGIKLYVISYVHEI